MSKHQDRKRKMARKKHSHNAVRITYYVESPNVRSHQKIKPHHPFSRKPQTTRTCGYDRRAELLAYANHLREADPETVHWSRKFQSSKPKVSFYPSARTWEMHINACMRTLWNWKKKMPWWTEMEMVCYAGWSPRYISSDFPGNKRTMEVWTDGTGRENQ